MARQRAKLEVHHQPIKRSSRLQEREKEKVEMQKLMEERKVKHLELLKQHQNVTINIHFIYSFAHSV